MLFLRVAIVAFLIVFFMPSERSLAGEPLDSLYVVSKISISGNKKTRNWIIRRELPFAVNDTVWPSDVEKLALAAEESLNKTSLFNFVIVNYDVNNQYIHFQ